MLATGRQRVILNVHPEPLSLLALHRCPEAKPRRGSDSPRVRRTRPTLLESTGDQLHVPGPYGLPSADA